MTAVTFIMSCIADVCIFSYYFVSVLTPKKSKRLTFFALVSIQIILSFVILPFYDNFIIRVPITLSISVILLICFFRDKYWKRFLVMFSYLALAVLSESVVAFTVYYGFHFYATFPFTDVVATEFYKIWIMYAVAYIINLFFVKTIAIPWWTKRKFTPKNINALLIALFIGTQAIMGTVVNTVMLKYGIRTPSIIIGYSILVILNVTLVFIFMGYTSRQAKRELEETVIREQLALQAKHYAEMGERYDKLRKLRHDFNNHIQVLNSLNDTGKHNEMQDYIGKLSNEFTRAESISFCGNSAVDAVLYHKKETAAMHDIRVDYAVMFPNNSGISEFDLCGIFSNLLDNAIAACKAVDGERYINLETKVQAGYFVIVQRNTYNPNKKEPKGDSELHGLGLEIIGEIVKKYDGNTYFGDKGGEFISIINLQVSKEC